MSASPAPAPVFSSVGYEICDERLAALREVTIRSSNDPVPRLGDLFTIVRAAMLHDLVVLDVLKCGADWAARCRVIGVG